MTTEIQQNRYDALLRRVGNLKGAGSKVSEVLAELFPMFDVENLPAELYILGGTDVCFGGTTITAAVAESGGIQLFNPAGSTKILTVTSVIVSMTANDTIRWGTTAIPLTAAVSTQRFRDTRRGITALPTGQIRQASAAALIGNSGRMRLLAHTPYALEDQNAAAVLAPGTGLDIGQTNTNTPFFVTFYWRERTTEPSEVNL